MVRTKVKLGDDSRRICMIIEAAQWDAATRIGKRDHEYASGVLRRAIGIGLKALEGSPRVDPLPQPSTVTFPAAPAASFSTITAPGTGLGAADPSSSRSPASPAMKAEQGLLDVKAAFAGMAYDALYGPHAAGTSFFSDYVVGVERGLINPDQTSYIHWLQGELAKAVKDDGIGGAARERALRAALEEAGPDEEGQHDS